MGLDDQRKEDRMSEEARSRRHSTKWLLAGTLAVIAVMIGARASATTKKEKTMTASATTESSRRQTSDKEAIRPFRATFSDAELADLRRRIQATKFPDRETVSDFSQGVPLETTKKLAKYWGTEYDWRKVEARLNSYPQFVTEIDGLDIHFIHVRSKHEHAMPLII